MCSAGCTGVVALLLLILSTLASIIHVIVPYWTFTTGSLGLWGICTEMLDFSNFADSLNTCTWYFSDNFLLEKQLDDWAYACQGLSGFGSVFLILSFFSGCGALCCCQSQRLAFFTGLTTILAGILLGCSLGVWGYFLHKNSGVMPFVGGEGGRTEWGYYLGVGGVLAAWLSGVLFLCAARRKVKEQNYM